MTGRRLLARMALVGALVIGLVGMHHLVIAACHHVGSADDMSAVVVMAGDHGMSTMADQPHAPATPAPPAAQAPLKGGAAGTAAMCLAILLLFALVLVPRAWAHLRRLPSRELRTSGIRAGSMVLRPPDLALLSVSRT